MTPPSQVGWHGRLTPVAAVLVALMLGAIVLSFVPVTEVEFGVQGRAQAISVDLAVVATMDAVPAKESTVTSRGAVTLSTDPKFKVDEDSDIILIAPANAPMTLKNVAIPEKWQVDIEAPQTDALRLFAKPTGQAKPAPIVAHYLLRKGTLLKYQRDEEARELIISDDHSRLDVDMAPLDIRIRPSAASAPLFVSLTPLAVRFQTPEFEQTADSSSKTRAVGTIEDARIWISHKGEARGLGLVDMLQIGQISDGFMRPLVATQGSLTFGLRGAAGKLDNTPGTRLQSLKPSVLDYLVDWGLLKILAAIFTFVIGFEITRLVRRG